MKLYIIPIILMFLCLSCVGMEIPEANNNIHSIEPTPVPTRDPGSSVIVTPTSTSIPVTIASPTPTMTVNPTATPTQTVPVSPTPTPTLTMTPTSTASPTPHILITKDVAYGNHEKQKLDIYRDATRENMAIFVYIHGGGWNGGDKLAFGDLEKATFFAELDCILVAPNYRLLEGPGNPTPEDLITDVYSAVAYIRRNASSYNADPGRIFIAGASAGGHLGAAIAYCNEQNWLAGTVYDGDVPAIKKSIRGYWGECAALNHDVGIRPTEWVDANDPPAFLVHGNKDYVISHEESITFKAELAKNNIEHSMITIENGLHMMGTYCVWNTWDELDQMFRDRMGSADTFNYYKKSIREELRVFIKKYR